jgi:MFS family permease
VRGVSTPVRNAAAYAVPELFWGATWALTLEGPMVAAFRDAFGGSEAFVGLAWMLGSLALGVPGLLSAWWVEPLRHKRVFVFWGHLAGGAAMLLTAVGIHVLAPHGATAACAAFLVGISIFFLSVGFLLPAWLALVGELFPAAVQPRVLGLSFVCNRLAAMAAGHLVVRPLLASPWSGRDQWTLLFALAGTLGIAGAFPFLWIVESTRKRPARPGIRSYVANLRHVLGELPGLRRFVTADLFGVTAMLTLAFYGDAGIQRDGFHRSLAGDWVTLTAFGMLVTSCGVAWAGHRVNPRTWFAAGTLASIGAAASAAWGGNLVAYGVAAIGTGIYAGVRASCHAPLVMRLSPGRDGTTPIGVAVAAAMLVQGLGPPLGAWVVQAAGYPPLFITVALLGSISVALLLRWVPSDVAQGGDGVVAFRALDEA